MSKNPWLKFYPSDWRSDPALKTCSLAARGLWIEMIALMHEAEPYGHLLIKGKPITPLQLSALVGVSLSDVEKCLAELEAAEVFSRKKNGIIYSRRMESDENKSRKNRENGKKGGNPSLSKEMENSASVNPQVNADVKAQKPEARSQKPEKDLIIGARDLADLEKRLREAAGWEREPSPMLAVTGQIAALLDAGADLETDVLPIVKAIAPKARTRTTWNYFIPAIQQAHQNRITAATTTSLPRGTHERPAKPKGIIESLFDEYHDLGRGSGESDTPSGAPLTPEPSDSAAS